MEQGRQINLETVKGKNETFYFMDTPSCMKTSFELSVGHMKPQHVSWVIEVGLNVFETKTVQKVCINGVLDTEDRKSVV